MIKHRALASLTAMMLLAALFWPAGTSSADMAPRLPGNVLGGQFSADISNLAPDNAGPLAIRASPATTSTLYLPLVQKPGGHYVTIFADNFEGSFPGTNWTFRNFSPDIGDYTWAVRTCTAHSPTHSAWPIGGGANGSGLACGASYPNNASIWMVAGPFDLSDATAADFSYQVQTHSENDPNPNLYRDVTCGFASPDNNSWGGLCSHGDTLGTWIPLAVNLGPGGSAGNLLGDSSVWIAFAFLSNGSVTMANGGFADDVLLRKCVDGPCAGLSTANSASAIPPTAKVIETHISWARP